jgi:ribosomal protein S18 acetylase RimI-like enzyme
MMKIRRMEEKDIDAVSSVLCACYNGLADREGYTPEQVMFLLNRRGSAETVRTESKEELYFVACADATVVGMVSLAEDMVTRLYVAPAWHRQGVGTELFAAAESAIRDAGFERMSLGTTPGAVPFYQTMGMSQAGTRRPRGGPFTDRDVVIMEKAL